MAEDNYYRYVSETGLIVPDTSEIKNDVENEWRTQFGNDIDLTESTVQGRIIDLETKARMNTIGLCALVANQINIDYATGQYLDAIGSFYGVDRAGAVSTRVLATVSGEPNTIIPAGAKAKTENGDEFYCENQTTIPAQGFTTTYFLSVEKGAIPCAIGTLTEIIDQTIGWEQITNPTLATIGTERETDIAYRIRIKSARYTGTGHLQALKGALEQVPNILSTFVYDNGSDETITYDTIDILPHSILVIADGGSDLDIATAILNKKSSGSNYTTIENQEVVQNVVDGAFGVSYPVKFNRPEYLDIDIEITIRINNYTGTTDELKEEVKQAILSWSAGQVQDVDGLKIGQNVSPYEIGSAVSDLIPSIYVKKCLVCLHGGTPATEELYCTIAQKYTVAYANIDVEVI